MKNEVNTYELAYLDYMDGLKYKDIAEKYGVALSTVKSWKTRYGWDRKNKKGMRTKNQKVCIQNESVSEEIEQVVENDNLSDKERLFCLYYIKCFNATKAYMKAYGVGYKVAAAAGSRLLKKDKIKKCIMELKQSRMNKEMLSEEDIFQRYMDIAFADIGEFVEIKGNNIKFKNSDNFDGTLIKKITTGKTRSIELQDQMRALQWLSDHMDMATEKQMVEIARLRAETDRIAGVKDDTQLTKVDELLEQIRKQAGGIHDTKS